MIELERTYLAKKFPDSLASCESKEVVDVYVPKASAHPTIRVRKNGTRFVVTKKEPIENDPSHMHEQTIVLREEEFETFSKLEGKKVAKVRYIYDYKGKKAELDVFQGPLLGLVLVDFEFDSVEEKEAFEMPDFCLAEVTHEEFIAGGKICGKTYEDIKENLAKYSYEKIFLK